MILSGNPSTGQLSEVKTYMDDLIYNLPPDTWQALQSVIQFCSAPKGTVIVDYGQIENHMRYTLSGVFVIYYAYEKSNMYVESFRDTPFTMFDATSFNYRTPAKCVIKAVTDVQWLQVSNRDYQEIIRFRPDIQNMMFGWLKLYQKVQQEDSMIKRIPLAVDRYKIFCKQFPIAKTQAPLKDIASYLGITQQSLSRIRRKQLYQ